METGALRDNPQLVNIQIELSERDLIYVSLSFTYIGRMRDIQ